MNKLKFGIFNILIIILVAAIGIFALVVYSKKNIQKTTPQEVAEILDGQVQKLNTLNNSDSVLQIEADLNSTNLEDLDQGVVEIDKSAPEL